MPKADFDRAKRLYPSCEQMGENEWLDFFDTPQGFAAFGAILGDIYTEVRAQEAKQAGIRRMGRRPTPTNVSLDEVMDTVFPAPFTMDPFPLAMEKLLVGRSQRQFARRIPCDQSTLSRMIAGRLKPDLSMMERIALAANVSPAFFVEYRAQYVSELIGRVLAERPNMGVTAWKYVTRGRARHDGQTSTP